MVKRRLRSLEVNLVLNVMEDVVDSGVQGCVLLWFRLGLFIFTSSYVIPIGKWRQGITTILLLIGSPAIILVGDLFPSLVILVNKVVYHTEKL